MQTEITDYAEFITNCDTLIRTGRLPHVVETLSDLNLARVPRKWRQAVAKLCRRAGLMAQGLRLLHPLIRGDQDLSSPPSPGEICEYAVLLSRIGSIDEALNLLTGVDSSSAHEAMMYQGFCHVSKWDYERASGYFESYLESSADIYSKLIARVNLSACYISSERLADAETLLSETIEIATREQASRLIGNCYELRSQIPLQQGDYARAREDLARAVSVFGGGRSYDQLLIYKWQSLIEAEESRDPQPLLKFKAEAIERQHWESVREADLFTLRLKFDQKAFDHLIFGTPTHSYRDRILRKLPHQPSENYILGAPNTNCLNLESGKLEAGHSSVPGIKIHQVLTALTRDFYAPRTLGSLFSELYPDEYFNIDSSPVRVRQLLSRTRRWLEENHLVATIDQNQGSYRLHVGDSFGILLPFERPRIESNTILFEILQKRFSEPARFSVQDACAILSLSRSSFHRFAEWAVNEGFIERFGQGKSTRYAILRSKTKAA